MKLLHKIVIILLTTFLMVTVISGFLGYFDHQGLLRVFGDRYLVAYISAGVSLIFLGIYAVFVISSWHK